MSNKHPNTKGMIQHAKDKTEKTVKKVDETLRSMIKSQQFINFNAVSEQSGVSKAFLYKHPALRERIETLRQQQEGLPSSRAVKRNMTDASKDVLIATLKSRIKQLQEENRGLKQQLNDLYVQLYQKV